MLEGNLKLRLLQLVRRAGLARVPKQALVGIGLICCILVACALARFWPTGSADSESFEADGTIALSEQADAGEGNAAQAEAGNSEESQAYEAAITVDVEGAVKRPGVYEFAADARVSDAIEAAGGLTKAAHAASVNRARVLEDGEQIYVPTKKEAAGSSSAGSGSGAASGSAASGTSGQGAVNLNSASLEELQTLNGIGPVLAQSIIDYREQQGGFSSIEDLKSVSGIGDVRFENLKDKVCV